jgi:hypothetical protein
MTRARDVANVLSTATALATDTETAALIATEVTNRNAAIAALPPGVVYSQQGTLQVITGLTRFYFDSSKTISKIRASVGTAPTGSSLAITTYLNGVSIGATTISASAFTAVSTPSTSVVSGDYVTVSITQVGSTVAGSDLTVALTIV